LNPGQVLQENYGRITAMGEIIFFLLCFMLVVLGIISFGLGSYLVSRLDDNKEKFKYICEPEFLLGAFYFITTFLVIVPYYNKFYRLGVISLNCLTFPIAVFTFAFVFLPILIYKRRVKRAVLVPIVGILILFVQIFHQSWRYRLTEAYLQKNNCEVNVQQEGEILGGIIEIRIDGDTEKTGAFENASHCLSNVGCSEEFYYCDWSEISIGP
jgi:hypothetical protein